MSYRRSGMGQAITPPNMNPGLPVGYDPSTGVVSGNPTGTTQVPVNPYLDVSLLPISSYFSAQSDIASDLAPVYCVGAGCSAGTTAPTGGGTPTTTSTWGNLLLIGGGILLAMFVAKGLVK
jgi:hypothetical protein